MSRNIGDTPRSRALGAELRRLRESHFSGSLRAFAKQIGISYVAISRWETGKKPPSTEDVATLLAALGVQGDERDRLIDMARSALDPTWVTPGVGRQLTALIDFESTATEIIDVAPLLIPGLLQIEGYARAIMDDGSKTSGEIRSAVTTRLGRQDILTREEPVKFTALIGENALRCPLGGKEVMAKQLRRILKMSRRANIIVRALEVSTAWEPSLAGPFTLYEFPLAQPIVHFEHYRSSMFLPDAKDVDDMRKGADAIRNVAMRPEATRELITDILNTME